MKVYRCVEFSKLVFMVSDDASLIWNQAQSDHTGNDDQQGSNWWLNPIYNGLRESVIADVIYQGQDKFFDKSLEYNAMQGGRFNPSRSFGVLYTSSNTLIAALEVLYHQFVSAYPLYKRMNSSSGLLTSAFNINPPRILDILLVVFEIEIPDNLCQKDLCGDIESLKGDCKSIGFERYLGESFNRNFLFGNDYEISRIVGCFLHSKDDPSYRVPSARIDFDIQDELNIRNYLIPERQYKPEEIDLTGNYKKYRARVTLDKNDNNVHDVEMEIIGETKRSTSFNLQPIPQRTTPPAQHIRFEPNLLDGNDRKRYFRGVEIQRFF
jgi:hypothetical protein